ncbi:MAG: helix-turn-helix domain-containing protein [Acidimicrobiia bacterium]|nr:helix-turn-helix domain-containing protein [Acidimicrobiia bacterium]
MPERKDFLTVEEVMAHLRVGRTFVYEQARLYLRTGGAQGLPCRKFGRLLRFPTAQLETLAGAPLLEADVPAARDVPAVVDLDEARRAKAPEPSTSRRSSTRRATGTEQSSLFTD